MAHVDWIKKDVVMPELFVGDVLLFEDMGAYSISLASPFHAIPFPAIRVHLSRAALEAIKQMNRSQRVLDAINKCMQ